MPSSGGILSQILPTLVGSLIGVFVAFRLDRQVEQRQNKEDTLKILKSVKKELEMNKHVAKGNYQVIAELQENETNSDHYALSLFEASSWKTAAGSQLIGELNSEAYSDLQDIYTQSKSLNEQIKRLRTEAVHPNIGEVDKDEPFEMRVWTISVRYWDSNTNTVETTGLGELIQERSKTLRLDIDDLNPILDDVISKLEHELEGEKITIHNTPIYFRDINLFSARK